jgi:hypothetical protein
MFLIPGAWSWCCLTLEASDKRLLPSVFCGQPARIRTEMFEMVNDKFDRLTGDE